ncbi:MAG: nuclear transport factor 2 family protein [Armatimonadetes bacterium]|nr:nuclear transport factor 2 family protein [Armatimonadota bacterium]
MAEHLANVPWSFAMHYFLSPSIELAGDKAHADWMLWQTCTFDGNDLAVFMAATTSDDYVRTAEGWKMTRMRFRLRFITRFDQPWSVDRNAPVRM